MQKSESIGALAAALAKGQGQMRHAVKDSVNPHFKNRYADLASVWDAVRDPLAANGLAIVQLIEDGEHGPHVTTTLLHASGEWIASGYTIPASKADAQGYGSAITYARRYALAAICGIAQDDDDGQAAAASAPRVAPAPRARTQEQVESIVVCLSALGIKEADQGALVKRLAGKLVPTSYDGAEEVIAGLSRMLDEKVRAEKK